MRDDSDPDDKEKGCCKRYKYVFTMLITLGLCAVVFLAIQHFVIIPRISFAIQNAVNNANSNLSFLKKEEKLGGSAAAGNNNAHASTSEHTQDMALLEQQLSRAEEEAGPGYEKKVKYTPQEKAHIEQMQDEIFRARSTLAKLNKEIKKESRNRSRGEDGDHLEQFTMQSASAEAEDEVPSGFGDDDDSHKEIVEKEENTPHDKPIDYGNDNLNAEEHANGIHDLLRQLKSDDHIGDLERSTRKVFGTFSPESHQGGASRGQRLLPELAESRHVEEEEKNLDKELVDLRRTAQSLTRQMDDERDRAQQKIRAASEGHFLDNEMAPSPQLLNMDPRMHPHAAGVVDKDLVARMGMDAAMEMTAHMIMNDNVAPPPPPPGSREMQQHLQQNSHESPERSSQEGAHDLSHA